MSRQLVLDTETTGLSPKAGHKIIEIGCVELIDREVTGNHYHCYLNPHRLIDPRAQAVHGITNEFLNDKPVFAYVVNEFLDYLQDSDLIIHNAAFDLGFLNAELSTINTTMQPLEEKHEIIDTLVMARSEFTGKKNTLDALCKRFNIQHRQRKLHGALLDSEILADVYLAMTHKQIDLTLNRREMKKKNEATTARMTHGDDMPIIYASKEEQQLHCDYLASLNKKD